MAYYEIAPTIIICTHRLPFNKLKNAYSTNTKRILKDPYIKEALYIASRDLYQQIERFDKLNEKEQMRINNSIMRYISRMSTRCTPFGLFAGCTTGVFDKKTNVLLSQKYDRYTRLDMNFLCTLAQYLSNIPEIKQELIYFPNNTLYTIGNEYRYIEYKYLKNERIYQISSTPKTSYLNKIISRSINGIYIKDLYSCIRNDAISQYEIANYIDNLIQSQILVSELDPLAIGEDFLERILSILNKINKNKEYYNIIKNIHDNLIQIDTNSNNLFNIRKYKEIENCIKRIGIPYESKYLFQVDIYNRVISNTVNHAIKTELMHTVNFLNKISSTYSNYNLESFKKAFRNRFEDKEVPLLLALDPEIGIGYPITTNYHEKSTLLKDFALNKNEDDYYNKIEFDIIQSTILKKISMQNHFPTEIVLFDEDFNDCTPRWDDLPDTFSALFEIVKDKDSKILIRLKAIGNTSGANLLARFAYTSKDIDCFVKYITMKEQALNADTLLAEIVHLPDTRVGNVLFRPHLRDYEIIYLANSSIANEKKIYASDLMISIKNERIYLRSKKLNKYITPHLTNAHNHTLSTIPIYRFLCELQYDQKRVSLNLNINFLLKELSYVPRIRYKQTILSLATWNINSKEIKDYTFISDSEELISKLNLWREKRKIPNKTLLSDFDNELFIDWTNIASIRSFFSLVKEKSDFRLMEFPYEEDDLIIKDDVNNKYLNECIITLIKK